MAHLIRPRYKRYVFENNLDGFDRTTFIQPLFVEFRIFQMLDENSQLIQAIMDAQSKGKAQESVHYQNLLHKNLTYLASLADPNQNLATVIPPPQTLEQATSLLNVC